MNPEDMDRTKASTLENDKVQPGTYSQSAYLLGHPRWNRPMTLFTDKLEDDIAGEMFSIEKAKKMDSPNTPQRISIKALRSVIFRGDINDESNMSMIVSSQNKSKISSTAL